MGAAWQRYEVGERIGCGGMAEVFEAELCGAAGFRRAVAIKRVHPTFSADPAFAARFVREAMVTSQLDHPNVVAVIDFDRDDGGRLFLVMERVRGGDLRQLMSAGRVPVPVAMHIATEILQGLRHAHELSAPGGRGVLHRDISPHNVLLSWDGAVKLSDFGIAKAFDTLGASASGRVRGKLGYMSPEQAQGWRLDARSDLFAVGLVLHELLTGRRLFPRGPMTHVLARLLAGDIPPPGALEPDIPSVVDRVVMRLLSRDRGQRYASAREALAAVRATGTASADGADAVAEVVRARCAGGATAGEIGARGDDAGAVETPPTVATAVARRAKRPHRQRTLTGTTVTTGALRETLPAAPMRTRPAGTLASLVAALARVGTR